MATTKSVSATRGNGRWLQEGTVYNNNGSSSGDWTWYLGNHHTDYYNAKAFGAGSVAYAVPTISGDAKYDRTFTVSCKMLQHNTSSISKLRAVLSTTEPTNSNPGNTASWRFGPTSGIISNVISFTYSTTSLSFNITDGVDISGKTIYLYLYQNISAGAGGTATSSEYSTAQAVVSSSFGTTATVGYNEGVVKIYTSSGWVNAIPYIYSSGWKQCIPYCYSGGWKISSG